MARYAARQRRSAMPDPRRPRREPQVHILLVGVGRAPDDGLPEGASGAALLCYASGVTEAEAVNETVAVLKVAGLAVLTVESHGTRAEMEAGGGVAPEEAALMDRALDENAVIVAETTVLTD
jgi:hypothetical protein